MRLLDRDARDQAYGAAAARYAGKRRALEAAGVLVIDMPRDITRLLAALTKAPKPPVALAS